MIKAHKLHFELTPANHRRIRDYIDAYNKDPDRVSPKIKVADVVNQALDRWLSNNDQALKTISGETDAQKA